MSRGIVLRPDRHTSGEIGEIWDAIAARGLPSMATHTHRSHRPHASLVVAETLEPEAALDAVGSVPVQPIMLSVSVVGVFPGGGLTLLCNPNAELIEEQTRVYNAVSALASGMWPHYVPGRWTPHITLAVNLTDEELGKALPLVLDGLPIAGMLVDGGVEDGDTGARWQ